MKKVFISYASSEILEDGIAEVLKYLGAEKQNSLTEDSIELVITLDNNLIGYQYKRRNNKYFLTASNISSCFRGLTRLLRMQDQSFEESRNFKELSLSLDLSRNAVMKVPELKKFLCRLASLGYDTCFLYLEDTYTLENQPYFGYLRGRFSSENLCELDNYAQGLGIELVPAIQTLSHLERPLKWHDFHNVKDTETSLMVHGEETYQLIDQMIGTISKCFKSERIHIGMDEALNLGRGEFLKKHSYCSQEQLFLEHLKLVVKIVKKYGKKPLIWSDMLLRVLSPTGDYYDNNVEISDSFSKMIPDLTIVYWDYYHDNVDDYKNIIKKHLKMSESIYFAGGIWTFNGIAPNYGRMFTNTIAAIQACKEMSIQHVMATIWFDDGAETPIQTSYLGLQLFADAQFESQIDFESVSKNFELFQAESAEFYQLLDQFDQTPGVSVNNPYSSSISKVILYQDILMGLYDENIKEYSLTEHYQKLNKKLSELNLSSTIYEHFLLLSKILVLKAQLGNEIHLHYQSNNQTMLERDLSKVNELIELYMTYEQTHHRLWTESYRINGWEVINRRYYGMIGNLINARRSIEQYLISEGDQKIPELHEKLLPYSDWYTNLDGILAANFYSEIPSVNKL